MLLEFGLKNFFSFKEGVSISFKLDSNCPVNISQGKNYTTVLGIKGANGSGKTHLLKGLAFLAHFCTNSFSTKPESNIEIDSFFNTDSPCELYAEFLINDVIYVYELSATNTEVKRECLYRKKGKQVMILERIDNTLKYKIKAFERLGSIKLRKNASIISSAHQYDFNELSDIYSFFNSIITNVTYSGLDEIPHDINSVSRFLNKYSEFLKFVRSFITECDTGISEIKIVEVPDKSKVKDKDQESEKQFIPIFIHKTDGKSHPVTQFTESSGTKALFRNLPAYKLALDGGGVLIFDEFDTHLHPHILPKLLQLFLDPEINKNNAQLLISTHDSEILNLLGRYRTYLVNKEDNASYAYRLDEIPGDILRNDRPILPAYNDGKIGGVPRI